MVGEGYHFTFEPHSKLEGELLYVPQILLMTTFPRCDLSLRLPSNKIISSVAQKLKCPSDPVDINLPSLWMVSTSPVKS